MHPFDSIKQNQFLSDLDFFVHYPQKTLVDACPLAVAEARAAGKPVILPPVFEETFGASALYAEPSEVWGTVSALWRDEAAYIERAAVGRRFAERQFADKLASIEATSVKPADWPVSPPANGPSEPEGHEAANHTM